MPAPVYIACLKLEGQPVLVVGGGRIATGKAESLVAAGASVKVVAPRAIATLEKLAEAGRVTWSRESFEAQHLDGHLLVIAATDDTELHRSIYELASARRMLVNIVDVPELCNFIVPAIHRDGPFTIAISSGGASPALAKRLRDQIAATFGPEWGQLAERLSHERSWARENLSHYGLRKSFFESIVLGSVDPIQLLKDGDLDGLETLIEESKRTAIR